jgi:hypothetical protein
MAGPTYWAGDEGRTLLERNKISIGNGVTIRRYFILRDINTEDYNEAIRLNKEVGVKVYIINSNGINKQLIRDFAICDDDSVAVELFLSNENKPERVEFYFCGAHESEDKIRKLRKVWEELTVFAKEA